MNTQRGADGFPPNPHPVGSLKWGIEVDWRETINHKRRRKEESRQNIKYHNTMSEVYDQQINALKVRPLKRKADEGN